MTPEKIEPAFSFSFFSRSYDGIETCYRCKMRPSEDFFFFHHSTFFSDDLINEQTAEPTQANRFSTFFSYKHFPLRFVVLFCIILVNVRV